MFKIHKEEIELGGKKLTLETGKIARQADGAIIATCGETVVISTVVGAKNINPDTDYFPLQVNYQEKYYAAGKIPGGYFKREARPTESETLISRLIDLLDHYFLKILGMKYKFYQRYFHMIMKTRQMYCQLLHHQQL